MPLFEGLTEVVADLAPAMLTHVLQQRRQRWSVSGLVNLFAHSTRYTMNAANIQMEAYINTGMCGVRANHWNDLVVDMRADAVAGEPVDLEDDKDGDWVAGISW